MSNVLSIVWSLPFLIGMVVGIVGQRLYYHLRARHEDKVNPLPDGRKRRVGGISSVWTGGMVAAFVLVYVLAQSQQTHDETVALAERTHQCQADLIASIERSRAISRENDELSMRQRDLLAELEELQAVWLGRIVNPEPPEIAALDPNDPRRQSWAIDVTRVYQERSRTLRDEVASITERQAQLAKERAANELPGPRCGER
ncbi:membrane protein [Mycobacterium phage Saguaro]|uniref:Membrane protein n=1 Tax=Mycobacterium phage Saguaro TaxID=2315616 RepID=A0A386KCI9_9CAUD|nr:membrane protein [Mycobacterium phage Saguaro]AYD82014.1 membrane protein [Mycobacterium phage Saguaro]